MPQTLSRVANATGLLAGTRVLTIDGARPVEYLSPGDRLICRSGFVQLRAIWRSAQQVAPVRIAPDVFGHTRPEIATFLAPDTPILIADWRAEALFGAESVLLPADRLVDGHSVSRCPPTDRPYLRIVLDRPAILYLDGLQIAA